MPPTSAVISDTVQFAGDQVTMKAFLAQPAEAVPGGTPGLVICHEWWGLNDHMKDIARRFAREGYVTLVPDLYVRLGAKVTTDAQEAGRLMSALSSQLVLRDLNAAVAYLKRQPTVDGLKIAALGFCMGGTLALTLATHNSELKSCVVFYGKVPPIETMAYLLCPVLYHYGAKDGWVTSQEVERLRQGLAQFGKPGEVVTYPNAQHAFFNETRPEVYGPDDAAKAWKKTLEFLAACLS